MSYNKIWNQNCEFGKINEEKHFDIIKRAFDRNLIKSNNRYDKFDYYSDDTLVELKSRNNEYNKYPTTMIGIVKITYGLKTGKKCIFVFSFTDGLYYWIMNDEDLKNFDVKKGGTNKRGKEEFSNYLYIPIEKLTKIDDKPPNNNCLIMDRNIFIDSDICNINKNLIQMSMDC